MIVADIPNKTKCINYVLIGAGSIEDSFSKTVRWLDICGRNSIVLYEETFVFARDAVEFVGFEINMNSVHATAKYLQAISEFPTLEHITAVRFWFRVIRF